MEAVDISAKGRLQRLIQAMAVVIAVAIVVLGGLVILRHVEGNGRDGAPAQLPAVVRGLNADSVAGYGQVDRALAGGLNADSSSGYGVAVAGQAASRGLNADSAGGY